MKPIKLQEVWFKYPARIRVERRSVSVTHLEPGSHVHEHDFKGFDLELRDEPLPHVAVLLGGKVAAEVPWENVASYQRGTLAHVAEVAEVAARELSVREALTLLGGQYPSEPAAPAGVMASTDARPGPVPATEALQSPALSNRQRRALEKERRKAGQS